MNHARQKEFGSAPVGRQGTEPEGTRKSWNAAVLSLQTERQAQLSPEQQKLLADWQAAKDRCEINRQLTDWIIDFTARRKRAEIAFLYHDCSVDHRDLQTECGASSSCCVQAGQGGRP